MSCLNAQHWALIFTFIPKLKCSLLSTLFLIMCVLHWIAIVLLFPIDIRLVFCFFRCHFNFWQVPIVLVKSSINHIQFGKWNWTKKTPNKLVIIEATVTEIEADCKNRKKKRKKKKIKSIQMNERKKKRKVHKDFLYCIVVARIDSYWFLIHIVHREFWLNVELMRWW